MGNCFTLAFSPSLSSSSSASLSSSSRLNSVCSISSSCNSCAAMASSSATDTPPRRILPFPTFSDLDAHYQLGRELGRGRFGVICLCTCRTSRALFACKSISKLHMQHQLYDILREVRIMQILSRLPSLEDTLPIDIVRLHEVIEDASHVHLIMELCNGGELFDHVVKNKCCQEPQAAAIIKSLMKSIQVCHRMGVMHRDIKPENILLVDDSDSSSIKLADFGLALEFSPGQKFSGISGSAYYIAPEVLHGEYSEEIDIWSAGVVLYVMLSGEPPFWGETDEEIFEAIRKGNLEFTWDLWESISSSAKDLVRRMLCLDVKARLTPAQVLEHPWILQHTKAPKQSSLPHCKKNTSISNALALKKHDLEVENMFPVHKPSSPSSTPTDDIEQEKVTKMLAARTPSSKSPFVLFEDNKQKLALHTKTCSNVGNQTLQALDIDTYVKTYVDMQLMALVAKFDVKCLPVLESLPEISVQVGWSCALLSVSPTEQIFAVKAAKKSYLISYNSRRKMGWKILGQHHKRVSSSSVACYCTASAYGLLKS